MIGLVLAALAASALAALPPITVKGAKFFTSNGDQFYIKGIAYQLTPDDPLADGEQCRLDASLMKTLGANAVRVYHVDPTADHDACMTTFDEAGIYVFLDLDTFSTYILPQTPYWNSTQLAAYSKVMDAFQSYDNVAGFFVGNEVMNVGPDSIAAPYVKAAARDMKAYRDSNGYRKIPIGYSASDVTALRPNLQNYMACGTNSSENLDFYSLNAYEWCGESSYPVSGYSMLQQNASEYNIPIFFSETGCNTPPPRTFDDQDSIFGDEMAGTWSGAIVYEWIQEANNYGLISYGPSVAATATGSAIEGGFTRRGTPTPISPDFPNLSSHWATLTPTGVQETAYTPSLSPPTCPGFTSGQWLINGDVALPTLNQKFNGAVSSSFTGGTVFASATAATAAPDKPSAGNRQVAAGAGIAAIVVAFALIL